MTDDVSLSGLVAYLAPRPGAVRRKGSSDRAKHVGSQGALVSLGGDHLPRDRCARSFAAARRPTNCHFQQGLGLLFFAWVMVTVISLRSSPKSSLRKCAARYSLGCARAAMLPATGMRHAGWRAPSRGQSEGIYKILALLVPANLLVVLSGCIAYKATGSSASLGVLTSSFGAFIRRSDQFFKRWLTHRNSEAHMMIGDRLRDLREAKHLSQGDIEKRTGLLRCYVSRVEHGHAVPGIETLEKWAHGLQVPLYQFFYDEDEPPQVPTVLRSSKQKPNNDWASRGKGLRMFTKMRQALSRMRAEDRSLLMHMARKVSFGR